MNVCNFLFRIWAIGILSFASGSSFALPPIPFPIFLKSGFSTVLEFEEVPKDVVLGDQEAFQVERLGNSVVIKPVVFEAATNMFVYFRNKPPRLFILNVSEEAEPTLYKKFDSVVPPQGPVKMAVFRKEKPETKVRAAKFDKKRDYLTVEMQVAADSMAKITPLWKEVGLRYKGRLTNAKKIWSERIEVQRDSIVKARFIFFKPDVPGNLKDVSLVLPLHGGLDPIVLSLGGIR